MSEERINVSDSLAGRLADAYVAYNPHSPLLDSLRKLGVTSLGNGGVSYVGGGLRDGLDATVYVDPYTTTMDRAALEGPGPIEKGEN